MTQYVFCVLLFLVSSVTAPLEREALFPGLDLDSGLNWTLDWTGLWTGLMDYGSIQHSLKPDQLVDALAITLDLCKSWIFSINAGI